MKTAGATGVLALQEHGLKEIPEGLFQLVNLRVRMTVESANCAHWTVQRTAIIEELHRKAIES